jgi:dimeric dUTPase (all-alpha-NTP-PPase superfamily)
MNKPQNNVIEQTLSMLALQNEMNLIVNKSWTEANFKWYRAIWTEGAEAIDHFGWVWWRDPKKDLSQVKLELVDIWHFGISDLMTRHSQSFVAELIRTHIDVWEERLTKNNKLEEESFPDILEEFVLKTLTTKKFLIDEFFLLLESVNMDYSELYKLYIGKNMLNRFRQANGYKEGRYSKIWDGQEDNVHLFNICADLVPPHDDGLKELISTALAEKFHALVLNQNP